MRQIAEHKGEDGEVSCDGPEQIVTQRNALSVQLDTKQRKQRDVDKQSRGFDRSSQASQQAEWKDEERYAFSYRKDQRRDRCDQQDGHQFFSLYRDMWTFGGVHQEEEQRAV